MPTGMPNEELELAGGEKIRVTLIDAGNPLVVLSGRDLGLTGTFALTQNSRYIVSLGLSWLFFSMHLHTVRRALECSLTDADARRKREQG